MYVNMSQSLSEYALVELARNNALTITDIDTFRQQGKNVNYQNKHGWTALMWTAENGNDSLTRALIDSKADVDLREYYKDDKYGYTALMYAASNGHPACVEVLLEKKANASLKDNNGKTALDLAKHYNHTAIVNMLTTHMRLQVRIFQWTRLYEFSP